MAELRVKSTGTLKLFENDNTSNVTIASPASLGADRTVTLPDANVTLASGTMLATDGSGASLTALNASELGSGTVPTARLGSGTASGTTFLSGDQTYKEAGGGKILQIVYANYTTQLSISDTSSTTLEDTGLTATLTTSAANSKVLCMYSQDGALSKIGTSTTAAITLNLNMDIDSAGYSEVQMKNNYWGYGVIESGRWRMGEITDFHLSSTVSSSGSSVAFKVQHRLYNGASENQTMFAQSDSGASSMILMEVGA